MRERMGTRAVVAAAGLLAVAGLAHAQCDPALLFGEQTRFPAVAAPQSVALADLDGDGVLDMVVANKNFPDVSVLLNRGDGTFDAQRRFAVGSGGWGVALSDLDNDGDIDMAVTNRNNADVSVLLNNGDGTFDAQQRFPVGNGPEGIVLGDLDGDGDPDMVVANSNNSDVSVLLNNGDGTFDAQQRFPVDRFPRIVTLGDLDGDGDNDMAVACQGDNTVSVLLNNGDGTFDAQRRFATGDLARGVALADLDGDGDADMAVANNSDDVSVLLNRGDGTFDAQQRFGAGSLPFSVALADLDGDGDADMAVANLGRFVGSGDVSVLLNRGDGTFDAQQRFDAGDRPFSVALADLDGDGDADLAVTNEGSDDISVLLNQCDRAQPRIATQPPRVTVVDAGSPVVFEITTDLGTPPLTFQWRRNGQPLADGGAISGATTPTLTINPAQSIHSDVYDVVVSNDLGQVTSDTATLAVRDACLADVDNDGDLTLFDFLAFQNAFDAGCP